MTTHDTGYARYDGLHLAWESRGEGPTNFVLVPFLGVFGRSAVAAFPGLRGVLGTLSEEGKVVIYDPRGTGFSSEGPVPQSPAELAEDLENVIQASDSAPAWLLVHHEAAAAALSLATRRSDLVAGMLFDSSFPRFRVTDEYKEGVPAAIAGPIAESYGLNPETGLALMLQKYYGLTERGAHDTAANALRDLDPEARDQLPRAFLNVDIRDSLQASIVPVLVTHGTANPLVPLSASRYLATHLGNKDFREFSGQGHFLMNTDGEKWAETARDFVRRRSTFTSH